MQVHVLREVATPCGIDAWVDTRDPTIILVRLNRATYTELDRLRIERRARQLAAEFGSVESSRFRHLLLVHTA